MQKGLSPGAIGVSVHSLEERVRAARTGGFDAVEIDVAEVARRLQDESPQQLLDVMGEIAPAGWGLPTDWRNDEDAWRRGLEELPRLARAGAALGCTRTFTYILPGSDERGHDENRQFHVERFKPIAEILSDSGCPLGLEYIGPKTLRDRFRHPFLHTSAGMLEMAREIGSNVGLLMDAWHWYTAGESVADVDRLHARDVVYVHVNDAPEGIARDEQVDNVRCLPAETGVIAIGEFIRALGRIGYKGPLVPEPFKQSLSELGSDDERLRLVGASMDAMLREAGAGGR